LTTRADQVYLYTPALYQHSFDSITAQLDGLLQYRQAVLQEKNVAELHAMRIEAKHLRYTIETFAPIYGSGLKTHLNAIRAIQEQLGDIHDCDVWIAWLPIFLEEEQQRVIDFTGRAASFRRVVEGVAAFRDNRQNARQSAYQGFLASWQAWEAASLWEDLPRALQTPFPVPGQIYPPLSAAS
jgi:CHAD domain-containing protein